MKVPGIPALQLRGFAELDRARLVSASKAKTFQLTGSNSAAKINLERLSRRKQKRPAIFRITLLQLLFRSKSGVADRLNP